MQSRNDIYVVEKGSTLKILIGAIKYKFYNLSINAAAVGEQVGGCLVLSILSTSVLYCVDYNGYVLNGSVVAGTFSRSYYFTRWQEYARFVFLSIIIVICFVYVSTSRPSCNYYCQKFRLKYSKSVVDLSPVYLAIKQCTFIILTSILWLSKIYLYFQK